MVSVLSPPSPPAGFKRVNPDGTASQAQLDYERSVAQWVSARLAELGGGAIPFPTPTTLGGVLSATAPTHQVQRGIDTGGNPLFGQLSAGDISGLGSLATANTVAVGSITGLGALATLSSIDLASQATGNLAMSHLNSGIDASSSTFLRGDGTWALITASPGGTSGQIQFNSAGSLGGFTVGGDGTLDPVTGSLLVTKTGGVAFGSLATLSTINNTNWSGTVLSIVNGGTGTASPGIVAGTNVTVSGSWPNQTINSSNPGGTVTSVALALPNIFSISGSPVTGSGTLTGTLATQSANLVFAGPSSGAVATPTFRALVGADLPNPSSSSLGGIQSKAAVGSQWINSISTAGVPSLSQPAFSDISGTASATQGGTAQSTWTLGDLLYSSAANTLAKLAGNITSTKKVLTQTGTGTISAAPSWTQLAAADLSNGTSGSGSIVLSASPTITGTLTAANANFSGTVTGVSSQFTSASGSFSKLTNTTNASQLALSGTGNDNGGYILGYSTNSLDLSGGANFDGTNWTAKDTTAAIVGISAGAFSFFSNSGLTIGNTYTPTQRFGIDATGAVTLGTVPVARVTGLAAVATSGSAADLSGNLDPSRLNGLSKVSNARATDVLLNSTIAFFDGPSVAQGTTGTWYACGTLTLIDTGNAATFSVKLWDGTTIIDSGVVSSAGANFYTTITLCGYIASPAGNIRMSAADTTTATGKIIANASGSAADSKVSAFRIA